MGVSPLCLPFPHSAPIKIGMKNSQSGGTGKFKKEPPAFKHCSLSIKRCQLVCSIINVRAFDKTIFSPQLHASMAPVSFPGDYINSGNPYLDILIFEFLARTFE
jgi:hypothetical protein